jgi:hypothetical protein
MPENLTEIEKVQRINSRFNELANVRQPWEPIWQEAIDFSGPRRVGVQSVIGNTQEGQPTGQLMYDGTAGSALQINTYGLQGVTISSSFPWFKCGIPYSLASVGMADRRDFIKRVDGLPEVKKYLEEKEEVLYGAFRRSNIYEEISPFFYSGLQIGTAVLYAEEDLDGGRIMFSDRHPSEFFIAENNFGIVDTVFRKFKMTVKQLIEKFGTDVLPTSMQNEIKAGRIGAVHEVIHAVTPKKDFYGHGNYIRPWVSLYKLLKEDKILSEGGYSYFPYIVWRYRKNSFETYGRGPIIDAMVEILGLNQISKDLLQAAHNATFGIWSAPEEMRGKVRINAKGINYYETVGRELKQINTRMEFPYGKDREEKKEQIIKDYCHVDLFMMLAQSEREMTAYEVAEKMGEKAILSGPMLGRLNSECFNPLIDIVDFMETRAGRMPEPPDVLVELAGKVIEIDFIGELAQAQKRIFKTRGVENFITSIERVAQFKPDIVDILDEEEYARESADANSISQKIVRSKEAVETLRTKRQKEQQAILQAQMAVEAAKTVPALNKKVEEGSPLEAMAGA